MGESGSDIIIKGGSVDLNYDETRYPKDPADPSSHKNSNKKITRVVITGDIEYDSGIHMNGLRCEIRTICQ